MFGTKDHSGAAIWFPPNYVVEFDAIGETLKDLPQDSQKDIFQYFNEFEKNRPKDAWYLEYLGVDPNKHSLGLGSLLLKNSLNKIDDLHQPAYLESSNPRNMSLYERHGFETLTEIQFGEGPPMHTMYREARWILSSDSWVRLLISSIKTRFNNPRNKLSVWSRRRVTWWFPC